MHSDPLAQTLPPMPRIASWSKTAITTERRAIFDPRLLPEEIRADPAYTRLQLRRRIAPDASGDTPPRTRFLAMLSSHGAAQNRK